MTSAPDPDDLGVVDELLAGMGTEDAEPLRPVLAELRSLAVAGPVLPNRRLAALLVDDAAPTAPLAVLQGTLTAAAHVGHTEQPSTPATAALPTSQAAADLLASTRVLPADEAPDAGVVALDAARRGRVARRQDSPGQRPRGRRPVVTAMVIALAAGAATAAAAVAQSGIFPGPDSGVTRNMGPATGDPRQAPSEAPGRPDGSISPRLAPAEQSPRGPSPASTAGPTLGPSSNPQTSSPAPAEGGPAVPLPSLPVPSARPAVPTPAPTVPDMLPLPRPTGLLPGGQLPLP